MLQIIIHIIQEAEAVSSNRMNEKQYVIHVIQQLWMEQLFEKLNLKQGRERKGYSYLCTYAERIIAESFIETCHINHSGEKKYDKFN